MAFIEPITPKICKDAECPLTATHRVFDGQNFHKGDYCHDHALDKYNELEREKSR